MSGARPALPPAWILVGGRGTRLGSACDERPKPMLPVAGRPFLEHIVQHLFGCGVPHVTFLCGYLGPVVERHFSARPDSGRFGYLHEEQPLGTGGAVALGLRRTRRDGPFLLLNGDSLAPLNASALAASVSSGESALQAVTVPDAGRYGALRVTPEGRLTAFEEKRADAGSGRINAGVYLLRAEDFADAPTGAFSLERDWFPARLALGQRFRVIDSPGPFLDIGTPESLRAAEVFVRDLRNRGLLEGTT